MGKYNFYIIVSAFFVLILLSFIKEKYFKSIERFRDATE